MTVTTQLLFSLVTLVAVIAQPERPAPAASDTTAPVSAPTAATTPEQAIRAASDLLDRIELGETEGTWESVSKEIDGYMALIQSADSANPWLAYLFGRAYAIGGRRGDAIEQLQKFVETREGRNEWPAYRLLGDLFVEEFPRLAKANYEKAAALKSNEPSILYGLSRSAARLGDSADSVKLAREAVDADRGQSIRYLSHLARMLVRDKQWDDAEREALNAMRLAETGASDNPGSDRHIKIADAQCRLLMEIVQGLIAESPKPAAYLRLAQYTRQRAEIEVRLAAHDAVRILEAGVIRTSPNTPNDLLEAYAAALAAVGRNEEAAAVLEKLSLRSTGTSPTPNSER